MSQLRAQIEALRAEKQKLIDLQNDIALTSSLQKECTTLSKQVPTLFSFILLLLIYLFIILGKDSRAKTTNDIG